MDDNLYTYVLPTIAIIVILSPAIYRIIQILTLNHINRWFSYKVMEKTKSSKIKQKILKEAQNTSNRDYYLKSLIKNPSLTREEINKIAMIGGNETRKIVLEKYELPANILEHIANDNYISYFIWYKLLEQKNTTDETKVTLALSFPEYIKKKQDGILPGHWEYYAGF